MVCAMMRLRSVALLLLLSVASLTPSACYRDRAQGSAAEGREQQLIDRAADALLSMRAMRAGALDYYLEHAVGVMIFPRVFKASLIFGGEGGTGVLLARDPTGWSAPAFYSMGAGSAGFQIGYQEATIVLFFMNEAALRSAISRGLTLGADASIAAGSVGDSGEAVATRAASDIYQFVEVGGLFAGASLNGTVVGARSSMNEAYYGPGASAAAILLERRFASPGARTLWAALSPATPVGTPTAPPVEQPPVSTVPSDPYRCGQDSDCTLTLWSCSPCGSCDVPRWAVSQAWLSAAYGACRPPPPNAVPPNCAPCPPSPPEEERAKWPSRAVCEASRCVAR